MTRDATDRMKSAAAAKPTNAPVTFHSAASPSSKMVLAVEKPTSKLACVRKRRSPFAEPTKTA